MKKNIIFLFSFIIPSLLFAGNPIYSIKVKINGLKDTVCYLGNYYADKQYIKDTAKIDSKGNCQFSGDELLPGGIYLIITPAKKYFEIVIDKEQKFSVETDTTDFIGKMKIKGSADNQLFYDYLNYINNKQKEADPLRQLLKSTSKNNKDSIKIIQNKLIEIEKQVQKYKLDYITAHSETLLAKVFKSSQEPEIPEAPILPNGRKDSLFVYRYYKQHFFDNFDFTDDRLLRTPVFHNKVKQYITAIIAQIPDTIIKEADQLIAKTQDNKETFKYLVWYITNWSETSNIMGFDAIFVHMVDKYYTPEKAFWVTPTNLEKITNRARILRNLLIGVKIPNITIQDTNNVFNTLYNIKSKYTVLYFWDPTCGHCQKETPKLKTIYDSLKTKGLEVYAVCTDPNINEWKKYIKENKLTWINVMDMPNSTGFHSTYDIISTPVIYLLDENKNILAKKISAEQLREFLDRQVKKDEKSSIK